MTQVIVYNLGGTERLGAVSVEHAIRMIHRQVARIHTALDETFGPFQKPKAVELVRYIFAKWQYDKKGEISYSKRGVLKRDSWTCAFCGDHANTVDHVLPRSRGGTDSWLNTVASFATCNHTKGARTPQEAKMRMLFEPRMPTLKDVLR